MYEFVCQHLFPGCQSKETGATEEEVREKAKKHLREHHLLDDIDKGFGERINAAIMLLPH